MKKILTIATLLLAFAGSAIAQTTTVKGTILSGTILDSLSREPESFSAVQFFGADDPQKPIAYSMTDENGKFEHVLPSKGKYILFYTNIGKKDRRISFTLNGEEKYDFGEILVIDDVEALNAATVSAQKTLVKMDVDKMTYKVEDDADSKTSTVLDMLRKVPMVSVDAQDNITVNGSSSFKVYVDGKPNQMLSSNPSQVLKYLPASTVKSIEVVTNPGARYDAEGAGGILNITTTAAKNGQASSSGLSDGQYGSISLSASNSMIGGALNYNVQKGKVSAGITANVIRQKMDGTKIDLERIQHTAAGDVSTTSHNEADNKIPIKIINANVNYAIDAQNIISASAGLMDFTSKTDGGSSTNMFTPSGSFTYTGTTYNKTSNNSVTASADYQHSWKDKPEKNFLLSYQFSSTPKISDTRNTFEGAIPGMNLTDRKAHGRSNSLSHSFQADFISPLGAGLTLSTGAKFIYRNNSSDQTDYIWDGAAFTRSDEGSLKYDFYDKIGAAYGELAGSFGKISFKAGLRYEYTWENVDFKKGKGGDFSLSYGSLVPAASLQYTISMKQNLGLSYNKRISRPGITYLNPYVNTTDPTQLSYGNTKLDTEDSHNFSLVYNFMSPKFMLNATLRYALSPEGISQYSFYDKDNLLNTTYGNIVKTQVTGLNTFVMYTPWTKTRISLNGGLDYNDISSMKLGQSNRGWSHNLMLSFQQTLPLDLRLSASIVSTGNTVSLQGGADGVTIGTLGLSKAFLNNKLNLALTGIVCKDGIRYKNTSTTKGEGFTSTNKTSIPLGQIAATLTWSFGKNNYSAKKAKKVNIEDIQLNSESMTQSMSGMMLQN